jgi:hypothetical protein
VGTRLTLGISEDRQFRHPAVTPDRYATNGPYASALLQLERLIESPSMQPVYKRYWERCKTSGGTLPAATEVKAIERLKSTMRWLLIHVCEEALAWSSGPPDYMAALRNYKKRAKTDSKKIKSAINDLRRFDQKHAYLLRHALSHALQDFLSPVETKKVRSPNANAIRGYDLLTVSGPQVREHEFRFLSHISLFRFPELLDSWDREIDVVFDQWPAHYMEFGPLRFKEPLSPAAAAKLNPAQLGLIAILSARLRDFTAGYNIRVYSTGMQMPEHGRPCWEVVAEFVNCALELENPLTGDTARRVWQSITAKHKVTLQAWPKPAKSESQVQNI